MPPARRGRPPATPIPDPTWGDRVRALRYVPKLIKLVWNTHPTYTSIMTVLRIARAFVPVAGLWIGKLIIDRVVALRETHGSATPLWHLVAAEIAIVFGGDLLGRASSLVESLLGDLFSIHTSIRLMEHAATLDLAQFEDPAFYDQLERARRQTVGRIGLLSELLTMGQDSLTLLTLGTALAVYSPWLLLLLAIVGVAQLPRRNALCGARVLAAVPVHAGAATARLSALRGRERRDREGSADVRDRGVDRGPVPRAREPVLRGQQEAVDQEGDSEQRALDLRHARLLRGLRDHPRAHDRRRDLDWLAHLPCGVVRQKPRYRAAAALERERHLRAEPLSQGSLRLLRDAAHDHDGERKPPGAVA